MSVLLQKGRTRSKEELFRDTRPLSKKFLEAIKGEWLLSIYLVCFLLSMMISNAGLLMLIIALLFSLPLFLHKPQYPLIAPASLEKWDWRNHKAGKKRGGSPAKGITYLGFDTISKMPVYSSNDLDRQHKFSLATTGGGKTQSIIAVDIVAGAMIQLSGFLLVDGKATIDAYYHIFGVMRRFGQEQNLLIVSFLKGERNFRIKSKDFATNSFNPLAYGTSSQISELLKSLLGETAQGGDDVWRKRAESYIEAKTRIFVYLRDTYGFNFSIESYRDYLDLAGVIKLAHGKIGVESGLSSSGVVNIPDDISRSMFAFLKTVAGLNKTVIAEVSNGNYENLSDTAGEQFNFISMQISPMLNVLATDYGHVFNHPDADVDLKDVVINRRGLLVLLPSLEYGKSTLGDLGTIIISGVKGMMATQLGNDMSGDPKTLLAKRAFAAPSAFKATYDEVSYYMTDGMDLSAAQGRGLGIAFDYATQELGTMKNKDAGITSAIWGSTNLKVLGKIEDADVSLDMISKRLGQVSFTSVNSFSVQHTGGSGHRVVDPDQISVDRREELDIKDLANQREGESFLIYADRVISMNSFYVDESECQCPVDLNILVPLKKMTIEQKVFVKSSVNTNVLKKVKGIASGQRQVPKSLEDAEKLVEDGLDSIKGVVRYFSSARKSGFSGRDASLIAVRSVSESTQNATSSLPNKALDTLSSIGVNVPKVNVDKPPEPQGLDKEESLLVSDSIEFVIEDYTDQDDYDDEEGDTGDFEPQINPAFMGDSISSLTSNSELSDMIKTQVNSIPAFTPNKEVAEQNDIELDIMLDNALDHPAPPVPSLSSDQVADVMQKHLDALQSGRKG